MDNRMNVLFITSDQQTARAIGALDVGYRTPNLDRLASTGVRFTGHISASAQCTPARAAWMTGRYPHQVGVNSIGHVLDPEEEGIAKAFDREGYETVYLGKWHLGLSAAHHGFRITDYRTDGIDLWGANTDHPQYHSYADARSTAMAVNYLQDYDGHAPFFMHLSWYMPHPNTPPGTGSGPFELIGPYAAEFPVEAMPIPASYSGDDLATKPPHQRRRASSGESLLTEELVRRDAQRYRSMVSLLDRNLGRVLDQLEASGLADRTAVVFTSDHGDMQGAHRLRLKGVLPYKELYNVPLLLHVPGLRPARKVIDDLTSGTAVPGTLLDVAGLDIPASFEGGTLLPLLAAADTNPDAQAFFEHYEAYWGQHPFRGVQTARWKYVFYYDDNQEELYDLLHDPDECVNIAADPALADIRKRWRREVDAWWEATGALSRAPILDDNSDWGGTKGSPSRKEKPL